jgi:tetratricopeptide (TPR) repeat protein
MCAKYLLPSIGGLFKAPRFMNSPVGLFSLLLALCSLLSLMGCSLPRVIILKDPLTPEEHLNLGVAYEKQGEFEAAIKEYKAAAKKIPMAYLYLGNVYFQKKEFGKAEEHYKKAIKREPGNADAHNNLAWLYYTKKENLEQAENLALKAIELNPSKESIYRDTLEKIREMKKIGGEGKVRGKGDGQ